MRILSKRIEATFATNLFRELYKNKDSVDFNKLITSFIPQGQDPNEWDSKMAGIKGLVASTLDHFRTIAPADPNQKIMEQLEALQAENAALKASQATGTQPTPPPPAQPNTVPAPILHSSQPSPITPSS